MRSLLATAAALTLAAVGCAGATPSEPATGSQALGLDLTVVSDTKVEGTFKTSYGDVRFSSNVGSDGVVHVKFDRGDHTMTSDVDMTKLTNDLAIVGGDVSIDDRFVITALSTVVADELGRKGAAADGLFRQATLWGAHPIGKLVIAHIQADPNRGWTTLCGGGCSSSTRNFYHDGWGHGWNGYYKAYGKYSGTSCRARCGAGCTAVGTSTYTQDCGNHDYCESHHSDWGASCNDQFTTASDDFSFAPNCGC